ncbi:hypothetical protein ES705_07200 [subsurface metagenome]
MKNERRIMSFQVSEETGKKLDVIIDFLQGVPLLTHGLPGVRSIVLRLCVEDIYGLFFNSIYYDKIMNPNFKEKSEFYRIIKSKKMEKAFKKINKYMSKEERGEAINKIYEKIN